MVNKIFTRFLTVMLGITMLFQLGCAGRSKPSSFYVLSPVTDSELAMKSTSGLSSDISIGIFPVSLPKYLKKQQIVTRTGDNELHLAEYDRWAGRIEEDIGRVIAENLSLMLATDQVLSYPPIETNGRDYNIQIVINRFDGRLGGEIELIAQWAVFDGQGKKVYGVKTIHIREPAKGNGYADMVAAQSRVLAVFSHEMADVIKELTGG